MSTRIGIIGSGPVGQTLANGFITHGYDVMIGTNDATKHAKLKTQTGDKARIGTFAETAAFAEIAILAVKGTAAQAAVRSAGTSAFDGKVVIDTTNPIADAPPEAGVLKFTTTLDRSLMEELQRMLPKASLVKAFSCVGNALMVNPVLKGLTPTMFICGNSPEAKERVRGILLQFGWEIEDLGTAEAARAIEPLCILWCIPGFLRNDWMHALKVLRP